jgi:Zn-dependent oligopeptidase
VQQTGPWDWDYLLHKANLPYTTTLKKGAAVLQQHLQLPGVVAGFSSLLQDLLGLQLLPRPAVAAETAPADVWAPHVFVLDVVLQQQQQQQGPEVLGTVYVDIGGGYGARMLRYARSTPGVDGAAAAAAGVSAYELPAVAVGISGARVTAPQHQQQQQGASAPPTEVTAGADASGLEASAGLVLSVAQLWELGHELGHAVHLVCSSR